MPDTKTHVEYYFHTKPKTDRRWGNIRNVASIDPGIDHFALRIESINIDTKEIRPIVYTKFPARRSKKQTTLLEDYYTHLTENLDIFLPQLLECHYFIFEHQAKISTRMVRISQHVLTYLGLKTRDSPKLPSIIEVLTTVKKRVLCPKKGEDIKECSINKAIEDFTVGKDNFSLDILNEAKKKDDLADAYWQLRGFMAYVFPQLKENEVLPR